MANKIGVCGEGWVGRSMIGMFPEAIVYDEPKIKEQYPDLVEGVHRYESAIEAGRLAINSCDVVFVAVPTPNIGGEDRFSRHPLPISALDTSIVEDIVSWCEADLIVLRSTVNPGTADRLEEETGKNIVVQPEFLGETVAHPMLEQEDRNFMIMGGRPENRRKLIETYQEVYNANISIRQVTNYEAEVIKLSENRAIMHKVAETQELYDACEAAGVDYYTIRDAVYGDDPRFNLWFSFIYPDSRGADSKCIPKDVLAWRAWAESVGYDPKVTGAILTKNREWIDSNAKNP